MKEPVRTKCALCLQEASLLNSHLMPKATYKRLRTPSQSNPNPVFHTEQNAIQVSFQAETPLLCACCEHRFHVNGEDWTIPHCASEQDFPLRDKLLKHASAPIGDAWVFNSADIPEVDVQALGYFALSIIWRAAATDWPIGSKRIDRLEIGAFQEPLRCYLLGETEVPSGAAIFLLVSSAQEVVREIKFPRSEKWQNGAWHVHHFDIPGMKFWVHLGSRIDSRVYESCLLRGKGNPIFYGLHAQNANAVEFAQRMNKLRAKGQIRIKDRTLQSRRVA